MDRTFSRVTFLATGTPAHVRHERHLRRPETSRDVFRNTKATVHLRPGMQVVTFESIAALRAKRTAAIRFIAHNDRARERFGHYLYGVRSRRGTAVASGQVVSIFDRLGSLRTS